MPWKLIKSGMVRISSWKLGKNLLCNLYYSVVQTCCDSMLVRDLEKAAEAVFQDKNSAVLDQLLARCGHQREIAEKIEMLKLQLGAK